jgi:hypothetical protein
MVKPYIHFLGFDFPNDFVTLRTQLSEIRVLSDSRDLPKTAGPYSHRAMTFDSISAACSYFWSFALGYGGRPVLAVAGGHFRGLTKFVLASR